MPALNQRLIGGLIGVFQKRKRIKEDLFDQIGTNLIRGIFWCETLPRLYCLSVDEQYNCRKGIWLNPILLPWP